VKTFLVQAILLLSLVLSHAETLPPVPLWPGDAPGALGSSSNDIPTITPFLPDATNTIGAAMVVCPGGGYHDYSAQEGIGFARWLSQHGVTCFLLRYRLSASGYHYPVQFEDATRAMRWVRAHADEFKIDPHRVGILGSSAGGHLAALVLTRFDSGDRDAADPVERQSSRPDIGILCYANVSLGKYSNPGVRRNLLGTDDPPTNLVWQLSNERQVTTNTPPCFIWATFEDSIVPMENSLLFAAALREKNVPFDLHIYQKGGHAMEFGDVPAFAHPWAADCLFWLKAQGFLGANPASGDKTAIP
jgi:acetyl esterase/lipase